MLIFALNFALGVTLFSLKNTLAISALEWLIFWLLILLILLFFTRLKQYKKISFGVMVFLLGFAWMGYFSAQIIDNKVAADYLNKALLIEGDIVELPDLNGHRSRFVFAAKKPFDARLRLSWYDKNRPQLKSGDRWQLLVKLKANNGLQNSAGFDYEKWLFYQQIAATGYVKRSDLNQLSPPNQVFLIDRYRYKIRHSLAKFLDPLAFGGVINALIIGDRSKISKHNWQLFQTTNTTHLSVISGLHIGLISGFVFLLVSFVWRQCSRCVLRIPAQVIAAYFGMIAAFCYALIAGFSIPTGRAFIMASVVFISLILRRHHSVWQLYGIALLLVLINNPTSVFSVGFWLSFYVVAVIIYGAGQHKNRSFIYRIIYIQLLISIATMPLVAWFFAQGSIASPLANLVAIPLFSFITTPLSLLGALLAFIHLPYLALLCFEIANQSLILLSYLLSFLQSLDFNLWNYAPDVMDFMLLVVAIGIAMMPKGLRLRRFSLLIFGLILLAPAPKIAQKSAVITVFDVGQGLSILVQTAKHSLLFDAGFSSISGFNMGDAVINPHLKAKRISQLDKIIISHGDNDHIGGLPPVLQAFDVKQILSSAGEKIKQKSTKCVAGQTWKWDGVLFEILNPDLNFTFSGNNSSCVLKVSTPKHQILLTGDIEKKAEKMLIKTYHNKLKSDIMIAPHHGSRTSSTNAFIKAVAPKTVIISSGFQNRFHHPAKQVVKRYQANNINIINTNCAGQINIKLATKITISQHRKSTPHYYIRQC